MIAEKGRPYGYGPRDKMHSRHMPVEGLAALFHCEAYPTVQGTTDSPES